MNAGENNGLYLLAFMLKNFPFQKKTRICYFFPSRMHSTPPLLYDPRFLVVVVIDDDDANHAGIATLFLSP